MERWRGRVALVTGSSSGIGRAITKALVRNGLTVVGTALDPENIESYAPELKDAPGKLHALYVDVTKESSILDVFKWVKDKLGGVDVMINNAGVFMDEDLLDGETEKWKKMLEVNVLGPSICSREAIKQMEERGVDDGHIVNLVSIAGVRPAVDSNSAMYFASKHAASVITDGIRKGFVKKKSACRVTAICPGIVQTHLFDTSKLYHADNTYAKHPYLQPEDIAAAVIYALSAPPHVQVSQVVVQPVGEFVV